MRDLTGKTVKEGQIADIVLNGAFHATVVRVQEAPLMASANKMIPPQAILQIVIPVTVDANGVLDCYVIGEVEEKPKAVVIQ